MLCSSPDPAWNDAILALMDEAFEGGFQPEDWDHALGGVHAIAFRGETICAHASVVHRTLWVAGRPLRCGYVEAVAVLPPLQGQGLGTAVMQALEPTIRRYELGALSTGEHHFYARLGWERWRGRTWVRSGTRLIRTEEEDDGVMVLRTPSTPPAMSLESYIACESRPGDAW